MAVLGIRTLGDPVLRTRAEEITEITPAVHQLVDDMLETMEDVHGAGLAAPQVGVSQRVFTYNIDGVKGHVINPVLVNSEDHQPDEQEGCLSVPGIAAPVRRFRQTTVRGVDRDGNAVEFTAEGMLARCFQHETDHLDGILFIDRLEGEERRRALRSLRTGAYTAAEKQTQERRASTVASSFGRAPGLDAGQARGSFGQAL
ncbi:MULTISPECIES: peptide deformylase [Arthrobacter]|uniref:Peptide deformylase n=2 Tax=Arthrobacter TaxID=1663 RepID=A0ABU9KG78_9MICC|nr:peptide deformylase [Arthrobacter sp. YJM1]MDP5225895.1 peptide deformylase [Arthrobacter sp. YJM1]